MIAGASMRPPHPRASSATFRPRARWFGIKAMGSTTGLMPGCRTSSRAASTTSTADSGSVPGASRRMTENRSPPATISVSDTSGICSRADGSEADSRSVNSATSRSTAVMTVLTRSRGAVSPSRSRSMRLPGVLPISVSCAATLYSGGIVATPSRKDSPDQDTLPEMPTRNVSSDTAGAAATRTEVTIGSHALLGVMAQPPGGVRPGGRGLIRRAGGINCTHFRPR